MKRKALLVIPAAAAVAAIVLLATGAFAGTAHRSDQPGDGFAACLAAHGVHVPSGDPGAMKGWLAEHESDPAVQAAVKACGGGDDKAGGPPPAELAACLERHGVDVPSDAKEAPGAFKQWLAAAREQPSVSAALAECVGGPAPSGKKK